jgi:crotonobetainyl-CoA:carnitine CoA-transferase CaiB-like acyl-CoA transferase
VTSTLATANNRLDGLIVAERAGRIAAGVCATLLAQLGATVIRIEPGAGRPRTDPDAWHTHPLVNGWKQRLPSGSERDWHALAAKSDVAIRSLAPGETLTPSEARIDCAFSAFGAGAPPDEPPDACDLMLQAQSGLMAVTGDASGAPQPVRSPVLEIFAGINGATSILAALRLNSDEHRMLDIAVYDAAIAALGTFHAIALTDPTRRFRDGCRHPLNAPWNAYKAHGGWVMICTASREQWLKVLELAGHAELADDPRFVDSATRVKHVSTVDDIVQAWLSNTDVETATAALTAAGVPAGPVLPMHEVLARERAAGRIINVAKDKSPTNECALPLFSGAHANNPYLFDIINDFEAFLERIPARIAPSPDAHTRAEKPLAGLKVVEISLYTAGPLAGRFLADLGADVIKIESPEGEPSRTWPPRFNGIGGYFANYNAGKRGLRLDLKSPADKARFEALIADADVVLQNLRTGALGRLGFGYDALSARHPALICCSISGYGQQGSKAPALDTVIQAGSGIMDLETAAGDTASATPLKAGFSLADLIAAHLAPLLALAALAHREHEGNGAHGAHLDVNMLAALTWTTQLAWEDRGRHYPPSTLLRCSDGWVACAAPADALHEHQSFSLGLPRHAFTARLRASGLTAAPVLEVHEVLASPAVARRSLLHHIGPNADLPVLSAPIRWDGIAPYPMAPLAE